MHRRRLRDLSIVQNTPNSEEANSEQQTVVGSSNVPKTLDEPGEFQTKSGGTCRGRGRTLLKDLYNLNPVERVKVSRNSHGQPVVSEARLLAGYLGILARNSNMLPINHESWHHMLDSNKNQALDNIKKDISLEEKLQNVSLGMLRYQWEDAVRFWNSKKGEDRE
ncbi:DNA-directed RNA polymerase subunit beta'' [Gossypium arboreum]|uniref:DNA-directed RNA polymerase subunit beta n=1 Tax=Gossypium arboreum TaxID=29729 RepID=A0A0B0NCB9_GOSAR|nr:DNA-directed RNA polymerase subunit beta'' [Gossypium arboreum]